MSRVKVAFAPQLSPPLTLAPLRCFRLNIGRGISTALSRTYLKKEGETMYEVKLCDLIAAAAELDLKVCDLIEAAEEISSNAQSVSDALATYLATAAAAAPAAK